MELIRAEGGELDPGPVPRAEGLDGDRALDDAGEAERERQEGSRAAPPTGEGVHEGRGGYQPERDREVADEALGPGPRERVQEEQEETQRESSHERAPCSLRQTMRQAWLRLSPGFFL